MWRLTSEHGHSEGNQVFLLTKRCFNQKYSWCKIFSPLLSSTNMWNRVEGLLASTSYNLPLLSGQFWSATYWCIWALSSNLKPMDQSYSLFPSFGWRINSRDHEALDQNTYPRQTFFLMTLKAYSTGEILKLPQRCLGRPLPPFDHLTNL